VLLAFGGGFAGYALVHHSDEKPKNQPTTQGYPLDVQLAPRGDSVTVSWRVPPAVVTDKTVVIVQPDGRPAVGPLSATSTTFTLGDMKPGQCVRVFAYYTAEPPPSAAAKPKCLPKTTSTRSRSG
jgi:hypothetical protein